LTLRLLSPKETVRKISWGSEEAKWGSEGAKATYFEFSREIDQWEDKDRRKFELGMRAAENPVRCATIVAAGCFSPTVVLGSEFAERLEKAIERSQTKMIFHSARLLQVKRHVLLSAE